MALEEKKWLPLYKVDKKITVMVKNYGAGSYYFLQYVHTFEFFNIKNLLNSEEFNVKYSSPNEIPTIAEKLRYYRYKEALLQKDVARHIGISESTYIDYENVNRSYYPLDILRKIADLYKVDFKCLLDDYNLFLYNGQGKQVKKLRKEFGLTQKALANKLNIDRKRIGEWEKNKTRISNDIYAKLKKQFPTVF